MADIREILKKAIEKEVEAAQEYLEAARKTTNPEAKSLLKQLAQDEARHRRVLEAQLALLMEAEEGAPPTRAHQGEGGAGDLNLETCQLELEAFSRASSVLAKAKQEIEKTQQAKEELYAMVTHDLRSPLISMGAFAKKLLASLQNKVSDAEHQKLRWIWSEARRLEGFVSNFLDLSRLTSGKAALNQEPIDPRMVIEEEIEALLPQAKEKGLRMESRIGTVSWVEADAWAVRRLFMNLLDNAVRHTSTGGNIEVGAEEENGMVRFWVADNGPGIPKKDLPHIFEQFHTGLAGRKGSGLGLAIAHQVVQSHGGRIWAESQEGKGATFYFTLPKAQGEKGK
jgi:two-component system sensor histidine kinase ResE